jgi:hypothetical protein
MAVETLDHSSSRPASPGRGAYPIALSNVTTAGFLGRTERGPINEPVCIESFPEYCRYFGGHFADNAVLHAVHDFFLHGGRRAVVVRVANRATRARINVPTNHDTLRLKARNPGRHEILRVSIDYERAGSDESLFNLVVQRLSAPAMGVVEDQELYPLISMSPSDPRFIATVLEKSRLISLAAAPPRGRPLATPPDRPGDPVRFIGSSEPGDDGQGLTDYDIIGSDRDGTGLFAFNRGPRCDLLAIPLPSDAELGWTAFLAAARYCEERRALLLWDPPGSWQSVDSAALASRQLSHASHNVLTYYPRIRPRGSGARHADGMPACGAIAGMLALRDRRGLWTEAERSDFVLRPAMVPVAEVDAGEARRLARYGINAFVPGGDGSMRFTASVTLGSMRRGRGATLSLDRRRLGFFILNAIEEAAMAAASEPRLDTSVMRLEAQLTRFLDDLYLRRVLKGRTPGQAYYLHVSPAARARSPGIRLGLALDEPGRFIEYSIDFGGNRPGKLQRAEAIEAEQLYS